MTQRELHSLVRELKQLVESIVDRIEKPLPSRAPRVRPSAVVPNQLAMKRAQKALAKLGVKK